MDIHKPKPIHSLREFFAEISVVVLGILIALSLEQGIELLRDRHARSETAHSLRVEMRKNLQVAQVLAQSHPCFVQQIADLKTRLVTSGPRWRGAHGPPPNDVFDISSAFPTPVIRLPKPTLSRLLWENVAVAEGVSKLDHHLARLLAENYRDIADMEQIDQDIQTRAAELLPLSLDQRMDDTARRQYLLTLAFLDHDIHNQQLIAGYILARGELVGIRPDRHQTEMMLGAYRNYLGSCVGSYTVPPTTRAFVSRDDGASSES